MTARRGSLPAGRRPPARWWLPACAVTCALAVGWWAARTPPAAPAAVLQTGTVAQLPQAAPASVVLATEATAPVVRAPVLPPAATQPRAAPQAPITLPYRYLGSTGSGPDAELVFFGRGRTVTLRGAGPLDDEYVIEALLDQRLQWRHLPTGTSQFMDLALRGPAAGPTARPEDSPHD